MMASGFPGAIDNFTDPLANSLLTSPSHATLHSDVNDAVEKIETYMGLVKVIPTSGVTSSGGTSATLSATGTVTIGSGNTTVTVQNAFSSLYDSYRIVIGNVLLNTPDDFRFRLEGLTTTVYNTSLFFASVTGATGNNVVSSATYCVVGSGDTGSANSASIDVHGPFKATRTGVTGTGFGNNANQLIGAQVVDTSQRTGFVLYLNSATFTSGTIRVYGYRN